MRGPVSATDFVGDGAARVSDADATGGWTPAASSDVALAAARGNTHVSAPAAPQGRSWGRDGADGFGLWSRSG
jgi:hypothetical protein